MPDHGSTAESLPPLDERVRVRVVLGSASPARLALLRAAGLSPEVLVSGVDEDAVEASLGPVPPAELVAALARAKADAVVEVLPAGRVNDSRGPGTGDRSHDEAVLVIGSDSMLELDGVALGKPADAADAIRRWQLMRGREGVLRTGHHLVLVGADGSQRAGERVAPHRALNRVGSTTVHFADLSDAEIEAYVATGEPLRVAGAFTIDGLGGAFVERIEGDHGNVVGLSLPLLRAMTAELGVAWSELWA